jgi:hypothetical protein
MGRLCLGFTSRDAGAISRRSKPSYAAVSGSHRYPRKGLKYTVSTTIHNSLLSRASESKNDKNSNNKHSTELPNILCGGKRPTTGGPDFHEAFVLPVFEPAIDRIGIPGFEKTGERDFSRGLSVGDFAECGGFFPQVGTRVSIPNPL